MDDERWAELVEDTVGGPVTVGTMFGSKGLRTGRRFFAIWWHRSLVVKVPAPRLEALVADGVGQAFEPMEGRPMGGWVVLSERADWAGLAAEAQAFVESLQG